MPFRFRRSVRLLPGFRLNASKGGLSVSAGKRGAHVTVGPGGTRTTAGIPGSGVSYTTTSRRRRPRMGLGGWVASVALALLLFWWLGWL